MKKIILNILKLLLTIYIIICGLLYFFQEKLIFHPEKLSKDFRFDFEQKFEEINITAGDGIKLNGILVKADSSKGLIFYLHGNAGSLYSWEGVIKTYTDMHYDVFMPDYRGFGKSEGSINSEAEVYSDIQLAYDQMKKRYPEKNIIVLGYSIGTGPAAKIASVNRPRLLVLQAPYYSLVDMMKQRYPFAPAFLLKYRFETNKFIGDCKMPVIIFHGNRDEIIYYGSSLKLKTLMKPGDTLITLEGQRHNGITDNEQYIKSMQQLLSE